MFAYIKITNYRIILNNEIGGHRLLELASLLLAVALLCVLAKQPVTGILTTAAHTAHTAAEIPNADGLTDRPDLPNPDLTFPKGQFKNHPYLRASLLELGLAERTLPALSVETELPPSDTEAALTAASLEAKLPASAADAAKFPTLGMESNKMPETSIPIQETPNEPPAIPEDAKNPPEETAESNAEVFLYNGFICDASGKIIGCQDISVTDGVLNLPSDTACTGIAAGALDSLASQVYELYIPANIIDIEEGAFDRLTMLCFIQVHPNNPVYESRDGCFFAR